MASNKQQSESDRKKKRYEEEQKQQVLKHLGFVRLIAINFLVWLSNFYQSTTKNNPGAFKSTLVSVETTITSILTPIYHRFKGVPDRLLLFLDTKVDEATHKFDKLAPQLVGQTKYVVIKLLDAAKELGQVVKADGPTAALHYANDLYRESLLIQLAKLWYGVNKIPPLNVVAQMALPTVSHISDKYNQVIADMAGKGYPVFRYLPSLPIDEIARAYKQVQAAANGGKSTAPAADESRQTKIVG